MDKEFWVDFQGSIKVKASDWEIAKAKAIGTLGDVGVRYLQIDNVEEIEND